MKIPKTNELRKQAERHNRKESKSIAIKYLKALNKIIENEARSGHAYYFRTFKEENNNSWEIFVIFRWYRRYSGLNIEITERVNKHFSGRKRIIDEMDIRIKWG